MSSSGGTARRPGHPAVRHVNAMLVVGLAAAALFIVFLGVLFERRAWDELSQARPMVAKGEFAAADRHYFQALNWYAPWGSSQKAAEELLALGLEHLKAGRKSEAYHSLLRLRAALVAARSFYQPRQDILDVANPLIALSLAEQRLGPSAPREAVTDLAAFYQGIYAGGNSPYQPWDFLVVFGFLLWVGASFTFISLRFQPRSPYAPPPNKWKTTWVPLFVFAYGYATWVFAMSMP
jgi:hypothetical protein